MKQRELPISFVLSASLLILFIILPLIFTLLSSSLTELLKTVSDQEVAASIGRTFLAAAMATFIGLLIGLPTAYILARKKFRGKSLISGLIDLPLIVPHTAAGIALLITFGRQGWLGSLFARLGFFFADTLPGVVLAMTFVSLPLLANGAREAFAAVDPELERVARVDGASPLQVFCKIALPIAWKGVLSAALMMWARGISEFGAISILAYHPKTVSVLLFERFQGFGLGAALPVTVLLLFIVLVLFVCLRVLSDKMGD
ncbi:MAG: ABC transporter permease [Anaerolineaceae bacterium]|nr:ABC transporter permease [Anaerolineaceae bacterium]